MRSSEQCRRRPLHLRRNQANLLVRDFLWECFFDRFEPLCSTTLARAGNLVEYFRRKPLRLKIQLASFNHLRDERDDGAQFAIADLRYFFERAPVPLSPKRFLRGRGMATGRVTRRPLAVE